MLLKRTIISERGVVGGGFNDVYVVWKNSTTLIELDAWGFFFCKYATFSLLGEFFHFRCVCGIFFPNRLTPPSKGKVMPKAHKVQLLLIIGI